MPASNQPGAPPKRGMIFLIEIRHSDEPRPQQSASMTPTTKPLLGAVAAQAAAPVETILGAWDNAQGLRNQQEFEFLTKVLRSKVDGRHFVFTYFDKMKRVSPLSWHLTKRDKADISKQWACYTEAVDCLVKAFDTPGFACDTEQLDARIPSECSYR